MREANSINLVFRLVDALVTSSKFQDFVSRAATASSQDSASKIQALMSKYESDMLQQLEKVKKLNDLEKDRFGFGHYHNFICFAFYC